MKASVAHKRDKFNSMSWDWQSDGTVIITLINNKQGKSGKFRAKVVDEKIIKILEDEEMK